MAEPLPASVPLTLVQGDSRTWTDVIERNTGTDDDPEWVPFDLTGHEPLAMIRATRDRDSTLYSTIEVEVTDAEAGELELRLTAEEADSLVIGRAFWDLQLTRTSDGFVRTHLAGKVKVLGDVAWETP